MSNVKFGLSMSTAWKNLLLGRDITNYRSYEKVHPLWEHFGANLYKYNYRIFVLLVFLSFLFSFFHMILFFSMVWYKPVCNAIYLKNRVKRRNIEFFKSIKGLE